MRRRRSLFVATVVLGTSVVGLVSASAGTATASFDIRTVAYTDSGQLLVRGTLECAEGSVLIQSEFASTFMTVAQVLDGPTYLYSEQLDFDDQVVCDGSTHAWQLLFAGHDPSTGQSYELDVPVQVMAQLPLAPAPDKPGYLIDDIEDFILTDAGSREPLRVDVIDVRYTAIGAVVVDATVRCPTGYVPAQDPTTGTPATSMVLEQWYVRTVGDTTNVFVRFSHRKAFEDQVVCDGTAHTVSLRFGYAKGTTKRFKPSLPIEVSTDVNIVKEVTNIRAFHEEVFLGV